MATPDDASRSRQSLKKIPHYLLAAALCVGAMGCASSLRHAFELPQKYVPTVVGPCQPAVEANGIRVTIRPDRDRYRIGEPIPFEVEVVNTGDQPYWMSRRMHILFVWTYPDGNRDSYMVSFPDNMYLDEDAAVLINPGQALRCRYVIPTDYFEQEGITEFRALYYCPRNTNPALSPSWCGKAVSNGYGVFMATAS